jgi:transposase
VVHHLGLALGGRPAANFARRLMLPVSNDTVLRVVRRRALPRTEPLTVVGVDDWAFRRNHRYGTIVCDLERRQIVTVLPDREVATGQAWLAGHPDIKVLSRDRGGGYGEAASKALPTVIQVADRWHLMENASAAFLIAVRKSIRPIRAAIGATTINPDLLTCAERLQYEGIYDGKRSMPQSWLSPGTAWRSSKSFARPAMAGNLSVTCSGAFMAMSSGRDKVRSTHI